MTDSKYVYQDLKNPQQWIRVVDLVPGTPDSGLCLRISHKRLSSPLLRYEALSYEWGSDAEEDVQLNGHTFKIRRNLSGFLRKLRDRHRPRRLWADAICINQSNNAEKNAQIAIMPQIYRKASSVLAWIGDPANEAPRIIDEWSATRTDERRIRAAKDICALSYWTRTWVMQELLLARKITIYCGDRIFGWRRFILILVECAPDGFGTPDEAQDENSHRFAYPRKDHQDEVADSISTSSSDEDPEEASEAAVSIYTASSTASSNLMYRNYDGPNEDEAGPSFYNIYQERYLSRASSRLLFSRSRVSLGRTIQRYRNTMCKDRRDKVYALLSLSATPKGTAKFDIDYNEPTLDLYYRTLRYCCEDPDVFLWNNLDFVNQLAEILGLANEEIEADCASENARTVTEKTTAAHEASLKYIEDYAERLEDPGWKGGFALLRTIWQLMAWPLYKRSRWSFTLSLFFRMACLELFGDGFDVKRVRDVIRAFFQSDRKARIAGLLPGAQVLNGFSQTT